MISNKTKIIIDISYIIPGNKKRLFTEQKSLFKNKKALTELSGLSPNNTTVITC
jgi:hypothetical protein